jgi:hypothetical protein
MKKVFFMSVASAALVLISCGDKKEEGGDKKMTACDCKKEAEELVGKMMKDPSKSDDYKKEIDELEKDCKDYKEEDFAKCKGEQKPAENSQPAEQTDNSSGGDLPGGETEGPEMPEGAEM